MSDVQRQEKVQQAPQPKQVEYKSIRLRAIDCSMGFEPGEEFDEASTDAARMLVERNVAVPASEADARNLERQAAQQRQEQEEFDRRRLAQLRRADELSRQRFITARQNKAVKPHNVAQKSAAPVAAAAK